MELHELGQLQQMDTEGNAAPITAAMVGGMIPPLAIATAMLIFRKKFTKEQRGSIVANGGIIPPTIAAVIGAALPSVSAAVAKT
jgi:fructose-specific phosphotransferase system IIC component